MLSRSPAGRRRIIFFAYLCSGFAGLVYQVTWTRLMVLHVGHTTAAVTTVVAAFMGGLAAGSALGARLASRVNATRALLIYAAIEIGVAVCALIVPAALHLFQPLLAWAYQDGHPGTAFPLLRTGLSLGAVAVPALLLGATFPVALRAFSHNDDVPATFGGRLYAVNTAGAALGAIAAGFVLLPALGLFLTVLVGASASAISAASAVYAANIIGRSDVASHVEPHAKKRKHTSKRQAKPEPLSKAQDVRDLWCAALVMALTGFAGLVYEVAWTRAVASLLGPTTYAFAGTVCALITGLALGSAISSSRLRALRPHGALAALLTVTALAIWWGNSMMGTDVPAWLARAFTTAADDPGLPMVLRMASVFVLILPAAVGLGMSLPIALRLAGTSQTAARRIGLLYALNTAAGVLGTLLCGVFLVRLGVEGTVRLVPAVLVAAAIAAVALGPRRRGGSTLKIATSVGLVAVAVFLTGAGPTWDRELLASGIYKYAHSISPTLDVARLLKAGTLLFYKDGQNATVSVTTFAGRVSLAIDGKVDGSTGGDMLTQQLLAHLPLLLHEHPRDVLIIGLGTGVTAASAAVHPLDRLDVVEISPEVVQASREFREQNRGVLADPRVRLIVGDGRSHLALAARKYDVIVSEPSNPWMAGVAALFTREAFASIRARLAPAGIVCQWLHTYDISETDFRSIVATFASVFPEGTMWTIGEADVLLVSSTDSLNRRLSNIAQSWRRPGVDADLRRVGALQPFDVLSLWAGGPETLKRLGAGAPLQTDDRMALEFSGPKAAFRRSGSDQAPLVRQFKATADLPDTVRQVMEGADAADWRGRGAMFEKMALFVPAYADYARALELDGSDQAALFGLAITARPADKETDATHRLDALLQKSPASAALRVAFSRLMMSMGRADAALASARAVQGSGADRELAAAQLAALYTDLGDLEGLERTVAELHQMRPDAAKTRYYTANALLMRGALKEALEQATRAADADPRDSDALNLKGVVLVSLGRKDEARNAFEAALRQAPDDPSIYVNLGLVSLESGDSARAAKFFAGALVLDPDSAAAHQGFARATGAPAPNGLY